MKNWNKIVYSASEQTFFEEYELFKSTYHDQPSVLAYIETQWIPVKEKFVYCYTSSCMHIGTTSSSRVEGNHHVLKSYLAISKLNLLEVFNRISLMLSNQAAGLKAAIKKEQLMISHRHKINLFSSLLGKVSQFALDLMLNQYNLAKVEESALAECSGQFSNIYGLPCKHYIRNCLFDSTFILLEDIHVQWRIDIEVGMPFEEQGQDDSPKKKILKSVESLLYDGCNNPSLLMSRIQSLIAAPFNKILPPAVVTKKKGRPVGSKGGASSKVMRDKSAFEYVEGRKCSKCKKPGHYVKTCPDLNK